MYRARSLLVDQFTMARLCMALALLLAPARAAAGVPDDPRLVPARAELESAFAAAVRDGVPEIILTDKVREGLAKGIPAAKVAVVVRALEVSLAEAVRQISPHVPTPPPSLLKAAVEARAAGAPPREVDALLRAGAARGAPALTRALDVVTDLSQRGFPPAGASRAVAAVVAREPRGVDRIVTEAQALSGQSGVTRAEALDAIARAAALGLGVDRAAEALGHSSPGLDDRGPNRETSSQRGPGKDHGKGKP